MQHFFQALKYIPKPVTAIVFLLLLGLNSLLFSGRKPDNPRFEFLLEFWPDFYTHISNFCLSFMLYAGIGYCWLLFGVRLKFQVILGIAIVIANLLFEYFITFLNTADPVDAAFGVAGTFCGFFFLALAKMYGFRNNVHYKPVAAAENPG